MDIREELTEGIAFTEPGDYAITCTGPMVVIGRLNGEYDPGHTHREAVDGQVTSLRVFHKPGDRVTFTHNLT